MSCNLRAFLPNGKYRKYRVIIVSKPKISCNIVWTLKKDIAEGWSWQQLLHWMRVKSDNSIVVSLFANRLLYVLWPQSSSSRFTLFHTTTISHWQQIHLLTLTTNILSHIRKYENQPGCRDSADCWKVSIIIILQFSNLIIVISQREREAKKHYKRAKLPWLHFYFGLLVSYFCVLSSF